MSDLTTTIAITASAMMELVAWGWPLVVFVGGLYLLIRVIRDA